jgi:type I restriction enzyme M protein
LLNVAAIEKEEKKVLVDAQAELKDANVLYTSDRRQLVAGLKRLISRYAAALPDGNARQHEARKAFEPSVEAIRGLIKQVDLLYKLAARGADLGAALPSEEAIANIYDRRGTARLVKQLDEDRKAAVEQLKLVVYFHRQAAWLEERFPEAALVAVPGLVKLVDRAEIAAADWSLTPGRYVGVAPPEVDEDFDFEQTIKDIHTELAELNGEAADLAAKIQANIEELGA